jgi:hypothetical protein
MVPDPRHAQPAPEGPDPKRWRTLRFIGLGLVVAGLVPYATGLPAMFPPPARVFLGLMMAVLGIILFMLSLLIPWEIQG